MSDGTARPWDLDQYRPGARQPARRVTGATGGSTPGAGRVRARYAPDGTPLVLLAGWTAFLTAITFGLYRFWMLTRLRRYYWRAIRIEGDPLEYTGRGIEKFLGFLLAIVVLAVYLGLANLALTFAGLSLGSEIALNLSILSAVPLYFVAAYKARRYVAARTRWRGIRFGMEPAAWSYSLRALALLVPTVLSAGLLYPLMHFRLEKFMTDRTWFGDLKFEQGGRWFGLFGRWARIYLAALAMGAAGWALATLPAEPLGTTAGAAAIFAGIVAVLVLMLFYQVGAFRYLWSNRRLGETGFANDVSSWNVLGIYVGGSVTAGLVSLLLAAVLGFAVAALMFQLSGLEIQVLVQAIETAEGGDPARFAPFGPPLLAGVALFYVVLAAAGYAFAQVFIRQPLIRRMAERMTIENPQGLHESRQRSHDPATEAGGFADALGVDVGAGL